MAISDDKALPPDLTKYHRIYIKIFVLLYWIRLFRDQAENLIGSMTSNSPEMLCYWKWLFRWQRLYFNGGSIGYSGSYSYTIQFFVTFKKTSGISDSVFVVSLCFSTWVHWILYLGSTIFTIYYLHFHNWDINIWGLTPQFVVDLKMSVFFKLFCVN